MGGGGGGILHALVLELQLSQSHSTSRQCSTTDVPANALNKLGGSSVQYKTSYKFFSIVQLRCILRFGTCRNCCGSAYQDDCHIYFSGDLFWNGQQYDNEGTCCTSVSS